MLSTLNNITKSIPKSPQKFYYLYLLHPVPSCHSFFFSIIQFPSILNLFGLKSPYRLRFFYFDQIDQN